MTQYEKYISEVLSGEATVCKYIALAVERHVTDLRRKDSPYLFSERHANSAIGFVRLLRHTKGKYGGVNFQLQDSQAFLLAMVFGWRKKSDGARRFTKVYAEMARKNGKSEVAAAIQLYCTIMENEVGSEAVSAATTREQARIVFRASKEMAKRLKTDDPKFLSKNIQVLADSVIYTPLSASIKAVSAEAKTLDGLNPHCGIVDEYHAHPTAAVLNVIKTGMGSRPQPLLFIITTAGFDKESPCYTQERRVAIDVLEGRTEQDNLFALIYTLDEGDDWQDEANWVKANPNIGVTPLWENMRDAAREAANYGGSYLTEFLTKNLNVWVDAPRTWIEADVWNACGGSVDLEALRGRLCFGGLDLAAVHDTTAFALFFPALEKEERHVVVVFHFLPESALKKDTRRNFAQWARDGWVEIAGENSTDYNAVQGRVLDCADKFALQSVYVDRWNSSQLISELQNNEALNVFQFGQGMASMSAPTKEWEKMIRDRAVNHGDNPVLRWMNGNVSIQRKSDDIKPDKDKSGDKIDGIVASIMAVAGWMQYLHDNHGEVYSPNSDIVLI